jgi:hypothetical protein
VDGIRSSDGAHGEAAVPFVVVGSAVEHTAERGIVSDRWALASEVAAGLAAGVAAFLVFVILAPLRGWPDAGELPLALLGAACLIALSRPRLRPFAAGALAGCVTSTVLATLAVSAILTLA